MKYLVCKKQNSVGCDYTIGCGMRFDFAEANSIQDVIEQVIFPDGRGEDSTLEGEYALEKIFIIPAEAVIIVDVDGIGKEIRQQRVYESEKAQMAKEIAELRRLQTKYGTNAMPEDNR